MTIFITIDIYCEYLASLATLQLPLEKDKKKKRTNMTEKNANFGPLVSALYRESDYIKRERAAIAETAHKLHTTTQVGM